MIRDKVSSILKQKAIEPQLRTELHHLSVQLNSPDAQLIEVQFNNRFYDEPTIIQGNGSVSYQTADGKKYRVGLLMTVQEYLMDKESKLIVGAKIFVRARQLPKKLEYPIYGQQDIVVIGKATTKYLGALSDAVPYVPQNGTQNDNDEEFENDPPPAITGLTLTTGVYYPSDVGKGQTPFAFIKANWDAVIHNDLQGYESDISENDNTHYDDKPDPKFNSSTMMAWTGLKLNTTYYVRVRAVDLAGNYSDWVEASITTPINDEISAPTTLTAGSQPPRGIVLHWIASSSANVFSYEVYRNTTDDISSATKIGESQSTVYFDNNLNAGTTYYYWVRAVSTSGRYSDFVGPVDAIPYKLTDTDVQANSLYNALADGSVSKEKIQAGAITADKIATGALLTYNGTFVNRLKKNTITYNIYPNSSNGYQAVNFNAGSVDLVSYSATNGWGTVTLNTNSASISANVNSPYVYVYILPTIDAEGNPVSGTYSLLSSTSYPSESNAVVLFMLYTYHSSNLGQYTIDVQKLGSMGTVINGDHIQTGSITANNIKAGSIDASKLNVSQLSAITADLGTITAGYIRSADGNSYWNLNTSDFVLSDGQIITRNSNYPSKRTELFNGKLSIYDQYGYLSLTLEAGTYGVIFTQYYQNNTTGQWYNIDGTNSYLTSQGHLHLEAAYYIYLNPSSSYGVVLSQGPLTVSSGKIYMNGGRYIWNSGDTLYWHKSDGTDVIIAQ